GWSGLQPARSLKLRHELRRDQERSGPLPRLLPDVVGGPRCLQRVAKITSSSEKPIHLALWFAALLVSTNARPFRPHSPRPSSICKLSGTSGFPRGSA